MKSISAMRYLPLVLLMLVGIGYGFTGQQQPYASDNSVVRFKEEVFDFGILQQNAPAVHKFLFKNISKEIISIQEVRTSCGCTTPEYSKTPIKPGRKGAVSARYDSKRVGVFQKTLTVVLSDGEKIILTIKGEIKGQPRGALPN